MTDKISKTLPLGILTGIVVGAALGALLPGFMQAIGFIGRLFINSLQVVVIPLILAVIISGVSSFGDLPKVGRTGSRILLYFAGTSAVAVIIGLALALALSPGSGASAEALRAFGASGGYPVGDVSDMLSALIPFNLAYGIVNGQYFGLILFSVLAGSILATMGAGARTVTTFFRQLSDVLMKLVRLILLAAPLGVFSLAGSAVADNRISVEGITEGFGVYTLAVFIGLALQAFVVLPLILARFAGRSPLDYIRNLSPALWTALGTGSSSATLPVTYRCAVGEGRVDHRAGAMVLPLGAVANLNGTVISVIIATLFLANVFDVTLSVIQIALIAVTTLLVSIGAAGVPMATPIVTTIVLSVAGFTPVQVIAGTGLIVALDWLIDRGRAVVNVWGDAVGAAVIAETFEFKTARRPSVRASDKKRESTKTPRTRGRGRQDSRTGRKPARGSASPRGGRRSEAAAEKPAPRDRRGRQAPRDAAPNSPFGISAPSTPMLDVDGERAPAKETSRPDSPTERQPQKSRSRDDSPRGGGPRQRESGGEQARGRRPDRERADSSRGDRRTNGRERRQPTQQPREDARPAQSRREGRPQPPADSEPRRQDAAKPEPDKEVTPPREDTEPVSSTGRLSPATVARELAKVSAQLAGQTAATSPDRDESRAADPASDERSGDEENRSRKTEELSEVKPQEESKTEEDTSFPSSDVAVKIPSSPSQDLADADTQDSRQEDQEPEPEKPEGAEQSVGDEENKPHFGRTRVRKGPRSSRDDSPKTGGTEDQKKIPAGYSSEGASFGRGRKKRDR